MKASVSSIDRSRPRRNPGPLPTILWSLGPELFSFSSSTNISTARDAAGSRDGSGNTISLTAAAGKEPVLVRPGLNGYGILETSNTSTDLRNTTIGVTGNADHYMAALAKFPNNAPSNNGSNLATSIQWGAPNGTTTDALGVLSSNVSVTGNNVAVDTAHAVDGRWHYYEVRHKGGVRELLIDGKRKVTQAITHNLAASVGFCSWNLTASGYLVSDDSYAFVAFVGYAPTDAERGALMLAACDKLAVPVLAFVGDSYFDDLLLPSGTTAAHRPHAEVRAQLLGEVDGSPYSYEAVLASCFGITDRISRSISDVVVSGITHPYNFVIYEAGVNDIGLALPGGLDSTGNANDDADLIYAEHMRAARHAYDVGAIPITVTLPQWKAASSSPNGLANQTRLALNTRIRANAARFRVYDWDAEQGPYNTANYGDDPLDLHPADIAYQTYFGPGIAAIVDREWVALRAAT